MELTFKIESEKFLEAFRRAPAEVTKELSSELKSGLRDIAHEAAEVHRFKTGRGFLEKSIKTLITDNGLEGKVYADTGIAPYAAAVHNGSKPHKIFPRKSGNGMFFVKGGEGFFVPKGGTISGKSYWEKSGLFMVGKGYVNHPGTKPDTFIFNAARNQTQKLVARINSAFQRALKNVGLK